MLRKISELELEGDSELESDLLWVLDEISEVNLVGDSGLDLLADWNLKLVGHLASLVGTNSQLRGQLGVVWEVV